MDTRTMVVTIISSVLASSGVWSGILAIILKRMERKDAKAIALQCLLRDRILQICEHHEAKGYADTDDRTNAEQLMKAYEGLGGDGVVHDIYERFTQLPMHATQEQEATS